MVSWLDRRRQIINEIYSTMQKVHQKNLKIDKKAFLIEISGVHGCSRRTALEYYDSALFNFSKRKDYNATGHMAEGSSGD